MHRERVNGRVGTGELTLTPRERVALDVLTHSLYEALVRRLPVSLQLVDFDLELELRRREDGPKSRRRRGTRSAQ